MPRGPAVDLAAAAFPVAHGGEGVLIACMRQAVRLHAQRPVAILGPVFERFRRPDLGGDRGTMQFDISVGDPD